MEGRYNARIMSQESGLQNMVAAPLAKVKLIQCSNIVLNELVVKLLQSSSLLHLQVSSRPHDS